MQHDAAVLGAVLRQRVTQPVAPAGRATPGVAPHPLSAHPRVPMALRQSITDALVDLATRPEGQALLRAVEIEGLQRADHARDYAPLEAFGLERYVVRAPAA